MHTSKNTLYAGTELAQADKAIVLLHGRGGSPQDLLDLSRHLDLPGFALVAPAATQQSWYPLSFLAPEQSNQPWLNSALELVHETLEYLETQVGDSKKIHLMGFSQGACLALESVARRPKAYGGVYALSGGLIGLGVNQRAFPGSLENTPVFLGCSDIDAHIPKDRVLESAQVLEEMGAKVKATLYPNFGHTVNEDELQQVQAILNAS